MDINRKLIAAHIKGDIENIARLYAQAASQVDEIPDKVAYYLTHAYVFALEAGITEAEDYRKTLKSLGREE